MNKVITYSMALLLAGLTAVSVAHAMPTNMALSAPVPATIDGGSTVAPGVVNGNTTVAPGVIDSGTTAAPGTVPGGSTVVPPTTDGGSTVGTPTPTPTPTPSSDVSASNSSDTSTGSSGPSSFSSSSTGGGYAMYPTCKLISSYITIGGTNDSADVTRLQTFLKNTEHADVTVTGVYDAQTIAAVKAFQVKYSDVILAPWGITSPSGNVYLTTLKKINQIVCNQPMTLTASEAAEINAFKNHTSNPATTATVSNTGATVAPATTLGPVVSPEATNSPVVGSNQNPAVSNTATVGNASILHRFWYFLSHLF